MRLPLVTVTFVHSHVSGPMRTGDFTMPWSLIGRWMSDVTWSKSQM